MRFSRRQRFALIAIGVLLFYTAVPIGLVYGEDLISGFFKSKAGVHLNATEGPLVETGQDYDLQSGNPFTNNSVNVSTANDGWVNFSSTSGNPNVTVNDIEGQTTKLAELDVSSTDLTVNPSDKQEVTIGGPLTTFNFTAMRIGDGNVDFTYNGTGGDATVMVTGLQPHAEVRAVNQTDATLDETTVDADGTATFTLTTDNTPAQDIRLVGGRTVITEPERPAIPFASFLWLGGVAVLATLGIFTRIDAPSRLVLSVLAALLWGVWGLSAFDVQTTVTKFGTQSEAITPLVYLGLGLAFVALLYAAWQVYELLSSEAEQSDPEMLLR